MLDKMKAPLVLLLCLLGPAIGTLADTDVIETANLTEILKALDDVIDETLSSVSRIHHHPQHDQLHQDDPTPASIRFRRSEYAPETAKDLKDTGVMRLTGVAPLFSTCDRPLHIATDEFDGSFVGVCVSDFGPGRHRKAQIGVLSLSALSWKPRVDIPNLVDPRQVALFADDQELRVLIADRSREDGVLLLSVDKEFRIGADEAIVPGEGPTAIRTWRINNKDQHLAIAQSPPKSERGRTSRSTTTFFVWKRTYFDAYASVDTFDVRDICPFRIHGRDYLVIVNHQRGPRSSQVDSELFQLDIDSLRWLSIQKIRTTGAVDCEVFELGGEKFLAMANHVDRSFRQPRFDVNSVIYKFSDNKFVPFQCLPTIGATSIKAVHGVDKDGVNGAGFVLSVAHRSGVELYQYNGWRFVRSEVQRPMGALGDTGPTGAELTSARIGEDHVLIVANPMAGSAPNVIQFSFRRDTTFVDWQRGSLGWCQNLKKQTSELVLDQLDRRFEGLFRIDQSTPIVLDGDLRLRGPATVGMLSGPEIIDIGGNQKFSHELPRTLQLLESELDQLDRNLTAIGEKLMRTLRTEGNQVVTAPYHFSDVQFLCRETDNCRLDHLQTDRINNRSVPLRLDQEIVRIGASQILNQPFEFEDLSVIGDVQVDGTVSGLNTSDIVTKTGQHRLSAPVHILAPISAPGLEVRGLINGHLFLNRSSVMTRSAEQTINSQLIFESELSTNNLEISGPLNKQLNLNQLLQSIVTKTGTHLVRGQKQLSSATINGDLELIRSATIAGIDLLDLHDHLFWRYGAQEITAPFNFTGGLVVDGSLSVDAPINRLKMPSSDIILTNRSAIIRAPKVFAAPIQIDHLQISDSINGIRKVSDLDSEWPNQLDIMLRSIRQTVSGHKSAPHLRLGGDSPVEGLVDGVKLSDLQRIALKKLQTRTMPGLWTIDGDATFSVPLTVAGLVDSVNLTDLYQNSVKLTDPVVPTFSPVRFLTTVQAAQVHTKLMNGADPAAAYLTRHSNQTIRGRKIFSAAMAQSDLEIRDQFNQFRMDFLRDALLRTGNQTVLAPKVVEGDLFVRNLIVSNLNGVDMSDLIFLNSSKLQSISAQKVFQDLAITAPVRTSSFEINGQINSVSADDLLRRSLRFDLPQTITGLKHFASVSVPHGTDLAAGTVNGYNLARAFADAVRKNQPQTITGDKTFRGPVHFDSLWFTGAFDGITDADLKTNWLQQGVPQTIHGDVIVAEAPMKIRGDLNIGLDQINGQSLTALNRSIVKSNEPAIITGPVTIRNRVETGGDVHVSGTVQGIDLSAEAVTQLGNIQLYGHKRFLGDFVVNGSLEITGAVDGVQIDQLCARTVRRHGDSMITAPVRVAGDVLVNHSITTSGKVNGLDLVQFNRSAVFSDLPATISGRKHFDKLVLLAPIDVTGPFSGYDPRQLEADYMSLSKPNQVIRTPLVLTRGARWQSLVAVEGNFTTADGFVNGVSLAELDRNSLKTYGDQIISSRIRFSGDVELESGLVLNNPVLNGIGLGKFVTKNRLERQQINSEVEFEGDTMVTRNLALRPKRTLQHVDIADFEQAILRPDRSYIISDSKHFQKVEVDDLILRGPLNGVMMTRSNLVLATGDNYVHAPIEFRSDVAVDAPVKAGSVDGTDLHKLIRDLVLRGRNNVISGTKTFLAPVEARNVQLGLINMVNITQLAESIRLRPDTDSMNRTLLSQGQRLNRIRRVIDGLDQCRPDYNLIGSVPASDLGNGSEQSSIQVNNDRIIMATINSRGHYDSEAFRVRIYEWNPRSHQLNRTIRQDIETLRPTAVHLTRSNQERSIYLFVAEGRLEQIGNAPLLRIYKLAQEFIEVQQLDIPADVIDIKSLSTDQELLVYALLSNSEIHVIRMEGATGFVLFDRIRTNGVDRINVTKNGHEIRISVGHRNQPMEVLSSEAWKTIQIDFK